MPITKTAKRALRSSKRKQSVNKKLTAGLEMALRAVKNAESMDQIKKAISAVDKASKKRIIHKNKSRHIKSNLGKLLSKRLTRAIAK